MKKIFLSIIVMITFSKVMISGYVQESHVHGHAKGAMIIEGAIINLEIMIPAMSVVGFEYGAKSELEKQLVAEKIKELSKPNLITFYRNKKWFLGKDELKVDVLKNKVEIIREASKAVDNNFSDDHHIHHDHEHGHEEAVEAESHSEFKVSLQFKVENTKAPVHELVTSLFSRLPNLEELSLEVISGSSQKLYEFNTQNTAVKL